MLTQAAKTYFAGALATIAAVGLSPLAQAQETFQGGALSKSAASALGATEDRPEDHGVPIGGWLVYPTFSAGYIFNDNIYGRAANRVAASGIRVRPAFEAVNDQGLHTTFAYVDAEFQAYPGLGAGNRYVAMQRVIDAPPTNVAGRVGVQHQWRPFADLTVRASFDATRQNGLFSPYYGAGSLQQSLNAGAFAFSNTQQYINQLTGMLSAEKRISDRAYLRATAMGFYTSYDNRPMLAGNGFGVYDPSQQIYGGNFQDGFGFRGSVRGGAFITPQIYAFVEPGIDIRRYRSALYDTNGYRVVAGLGSDMFSLFRGEIYGGYQSQSSASGLFGRTSAPAYGARLFYYPTRDVTLSLSGDQTLSSSAAPLLATGVTSPFWHVGGERWAAASRTRQILAQGEYALSPRLSAYLRGGYGETTFSSPSLFGAANFSTNAWSAGGGLNYQLWRNLSVSVDYQFLKTRLRSEPFQRQNVAFATSPGFARNVVSVGLNWRF